MKTGNRKKGPIEYTGTFISNPRGFGFVETEDLEEDIFIPEGHTGGAFHMDTVRVHLTREKSGDSRAEGHVDAVVSHGIIDVVGTFDKGKGFGFVVPDNQKIGTDIFVPSGVRMSIGADSFCLE